MDDDGKDIHIPGPGNVDGDSILTNVTDWIIGHGTVSAAVIVGIVGLGIWNRHKVLSAALGAAMLVFLLMSIKG